MNTFSDTIQFCLKEIKTKGMEGVRTICNCTIPSKALLAEYQKQEIKLEDLDQSEKNELWETVKEMFPGKTKKELIDVCKIIHTIGQLI